MKPRLTIAAAASLLFSCGAQAAEIKLLASAALKAAYLELIRDFEGESGHKVTADWSSSQVIKKRIEAGEAADIVIVASVLGRSLADELIKEGKLAGTPVVLAKSGVGIAVRAGAPVPDISTVDAVKTAVLDANTIAHSAGASSVYMVNIAAETRHLRSSQIESGHRATERTRGRGRCTRRCPRLDSSR